MAITPLGNEYKGLEFDGVSSKTYGVMIYGEGVFNAPERDVEMIKIPGRSGTFALDKGRFENIEVTYPARLIADNTADFASAISDFRNALCSRKGYVRLTDDYHPDEYRMAIYKEGLEVDEQVLRAGEFDIVFDCKPQRWLTSGETAVSVTSGDTISNPTLFEASPLLEVEGYGDISINGQLIKIYNITYGNILLYNATEETLTYRSPVNIPIELNNMSVLETGDKIGEGNTLLIKATFYRNIPNTNWERVTGATPPWIEGKTIIGGIDCPTATFALELQKGTPLTISAGIRWGSNPYEMTTWLTFTYDGQSSISFTAERKPDMEGDNPDSIIVAVSNIYGNSTALMTGHPIYIDLDTGEAWNEDSGAPVSLNNTVLLPALLPTLSPGANEITFDNTITDLKVTPRWWRV